MRALWPCLLAACGRLGFAPVESTSDGSDADVVELCRTTVCCDAVGTGTCYYVDASRGDDANDGSFAAPWRSYLNVITWIDDGVNSSPATRPTALRPGDVVYFMDGVYSQVYPWSTIMRGLHIERLTGMPEVPIVLAAYPGHAPVIATPTTVAVALDSPSHVHVRGVAIEAAFQTGIRLTNGNEVVLEDLRIRGVTNTITGTVSGIGGSQCTNVTMRNLDIADIVGTTGAYGIFLPLSSLVLTNSRIAYIQPQPAVCVNGVNSNSRIENNTFVNCAGGVRLSGDNIIATGNLVQRAQIEIFNDMTTIDVSFNTLLDSQLQISPRFASAAPRAITFRSNIVLDTLSTAFDASSALISVAPAISGEWKAEFDSGNALTSNGNCFHATQTAPRLAYYDTVEALAQWQVRGFDVQSSLGDPQLDADLRPTTPACTGYGHTAVQQ